MKHAEKNLIDLEDSSDIDSEVESEETEKFDINLNESYEEE